MSKKAILPQHRRHIMIYDEDWEFLEQNYGPSSASRLGAGIAVREWLHKRVLELRAKQNERLDARASVLSPLAIAEQVKETGQ